MTPKNSIKIADVTVSIVLGDITELQVDAIVNAANNHLVMGGGVAAAIKRHGGKVIEDDAVKKGPIEIGQAIYSGAGKLKAKYVIHAATMGLDFHTDETNVRHSCRNALRVASELNLQSIAFPALGCGVGGFPVSGTAKIMAQEVLRLLKESVPSLKEIFFVLHDQQSYDVFERDALGYLDYITYQLKNPFCCVDIIIETAEGIVLIERTNPPYGWAIPGGFVDYGESLEQAAQREAEEETSLHIENVKQFHTYSNPERDPRFHTVSTVFKATAKGQPRAGSDAAKVRVFKKDKLPPQLAFDHRLILADYLSQKSF